MTTRTALRSALLLTAVHLQACGDARPAGLEEGVSLTLARIRAETLSEVAYDVELSVPADRGEAVRGSILLSFVWDDAEGRDVVVDFKDPASRVEAVSVDGAPVEWEVAYDHLLLPAEVLTPGSANRVRIDFRAGDEALNRSDEFLYTLFVPDRAHFSLPVFDQPDLKARVAWTLTVPEGWVAVANGPADEARSDPGAAPGVRRFRFAESAPIPTYLMAFAAGRFTVERGERDGRVYHMYHRETDLEKVEANRDEIFDLVATSMAWMEDYTGLDYPFAKYDFVLIPSFQYGGMEHPGAVLYRASSLLLEPSATQNARLGRASLIAHETAHMWFGDLVTMRWFDDVWTKEVFANFMAAKIVHPSFPEVDHDLRFLLAHHPAAYAVDRTPGANAIRQPLDNLREAGTLYGPIIYQKAPVAMRQLEDRVGEEIMRVGLRRYLERFAYGNASWPDLVAILNEPTPDDLEVWSRSWIEEPGRPTVRLQMDSTDAGLRPVVRQSDPWGRGRVWPQRLRLLEVRGPQSRITAILDLQEAEAAFPRWRSGAPPRWVLPNGAGIEYGRFVLEEEALTNLLEDLPRIEMALVRGAGWMVVADALLEGQLPPGRVLDRAVEAVAEEDDELLVDFLLDLVASIYWDLLSPEERAERAGGVEDVLWRGLDAAEQTTLKATWFQGWRRIALSSGAVERMHRIWEGVDSIPGLPLSESDLTALAEALAVRGAPGADAILDAQAARITNPDRLDRFRFVRPALSPDPAEREAFFAALSDPANREREPWVLDGLAYLNHPLRQEHARAFLRPGLEMIEEIQATGDIFFPARWLGALLGGHQTPEAAAIVADFVEGERRLPPRLRGKVLQAADGVVRSARIVYGQAPELPTLEPTS